MLRFLLLRTSQNAISPLGLMLTLTPTQPDVGAPELSVFTRRTLIAFRVRARTDDVSPAKVAFRRFT